MEPLESAGADLDIKKIAESCNQIMDPDGKAPLLVTHASVMHCRQRARELAGKRHDPNQKAQDFAAGIAEDLFSGALQDYYPQKKVKGAGSDSCYVRRDKLTADDVEYNAHRMDAAGDSLKEHASALRAWWASQ